MSFSSVVFPAFGGETTSARCPRPIGQKRSTNRHDTGHPGYSSVSRGCGSMLVNSSNFRRMGRCGSPGRSIANSSSASTLPPPPPEPPPPNPRPPCLGGCPLREVPCPPPYPPCPSCWPCEGCPPGPPGPPGPPPCPPRPRPPRLRLGFQCPTDTLPPNPGSAAPRSGFNRRTPEEPRRTSPRPDVNPCSLRPRPRVLRAGEYREMTRIRESPRNSTRPRMDPVCGKRSTHRPTKPLTNRERARNRHVLPHKAAQHSRPQPGQSKERNPSGLLAPRHKRQATGRRPTCES